MIRTATLAGALAAASAAGAAPPTGVLRIMVDNVRSSSGKVHVDICAREQFLKKCFASASAPARTGVTVVTVDGLAPGLYAAQVFFDENGNGKVDRALFGIPKEGVGFSNDAKIVLSPPKFDDAAFAFKGGEQTIRLKLRYFLGARSPG